jgi:hypothetical protein
VIAIGVAVAFAHRMQTVEIAIEDNLARSVRLLLVGFLCSSPSHTRALHVVEQASGLRSFDAINMNAGGLTFKDEVSPFSGKPLCFGRAR